MKENKSISIGVRLNELQVNVLDKLINKGICKTRSAGIQYLINQQAILWSNEKK